MAEGRTLDAAGITDPALRASYALCRRLHARHGRTYYLATMLLPPAKRPYVHALYGFARYADEIVDRLDGPDASARAEVLDRWGDGILADLRDGRSSDPVGRALVHTATTWSIPAGHFEAFLRSMRADLTVSGFATFDDLRGYMHGSAAVIGLQMTPILEPVTVEAYARAADLGVAFQLTNFIRDVKEDLARGRVYLPAEDLQRYGVSRADLERGSLTPGMRAVLAYETARARRFYERARPGIGMLHPTSRSCITTAFTLYRAILDEVELAGYDVFSQRARVSRRRRLAVAVPALVRAHHARVQSIPAGTGSAR